MKAVAATEFLLLLVLCGLAYLLWLQQAQIVDLTEYVDRELAALKPKPKPRPSRPAKPKETP